MVMSGTYAYDSQSVMWQLASHAEEEAKALRCKGAKALKKKPVENTMARSNSANFSGDFRNQVSGYPVYDRKLLESIIRKGGQVTLIGDAAHL
jgi:hypothetical protein